MRGCSNYFGCVTTFLICAGVVGLVGKRASGQEQPVASIVEEFYPPSLDLPAGSGSSRQQCFAVYDADASARPQTIVAAYTNSAEGRIRVLRARAGTFDVVAEPEGGLDLSGVWCGVSLEDVDGDGRKEIRVDFTLNRDTVSWLFRWDGQQLWNLTPTTTTAIGGYQISSFVNGGLVDADDDGTKEIYVQPRYPSFRDEPVLPAVLYRLSGNRYAEHMRLVGMWTFKPGSRASETSTVSVVIPQGARGPYTLRVVNGLPDGMARAAGAEVWINGKETLSPVDFGNSVGVIERAVTLMPENELMVRLAGQFSGEIQIIIESEDWNR
jgi:hypothetical protein